MNETKKDDDDISFLKRKIDAYWLLGTKLHITLNSGMWKRGIIVQDPKAHSDFFMLDESLEGDVPIFWIEVKSIEAYRPKEEAK